MDNLLINSHELPAPSKSVEIFDPTVSSSTDIEIKGGEINKEASSVPNQQPIIPVQITPAPVQQTTNTSATFDDNTDNSNLKAEDVDIIEKEWVNKAKKVVSSTRSDPRQQNIDMAKLKTEYIKKRYNKTLVTEEPK